MSKDRDRQGPGNVGAGNKSADKGGKSAGSAAAKGASSAPAKDKGGLGGFFGGNKGPSGPTAADRPRARPDVVKTGTGKDARFMDTRTGQSYAAPEYGAFSFRGLTSNDPANVARNRYGAERAMAAQAELDRRDGGIASLVARAEPAPPVNPEVPAMTAAELAMIGAPTTPMAPTFVDSPVYGMGMPMGGQSMMGYGSAFSGSPTAPQFSMMDLVDLFGPSMNFGR
jgi:hypothetical protein